MEEAKNSQVTNFQITKLTKHFSTMSPGRLILVVAGASILLGVITGLILSAKGGVASTPLGSVGTPTAPQQDTRTFRDFAEGVIKAKPQPSQGQYTEGTHTLIRQGAVPVALTSSVVDLSKYEGKKVKVFGETQKALTEGWLMDVGKVEELK